MTYPCMLKLSYDAGKPLNHISKTNISSLLFCSYSMTIIIISSLLLSIMCVFICVANLLFCTQPPTVCWFQDASYELTILDASTKVQSLPTRRGRYQGGGIATISEAYDAGVDLERVYDVLVIIDTLTGTKNASSRFSKLIKSNVCVVTMFCFYRHKLQYRTAR